MNGLNKKVVKVAVVDLYAGTVNQGMRGIRTILKIFQEKYQIQFQVDEFELRNQLQIPDLSYDIYLSSGGPGSPIEPNLAEWEKLYFNWLNNLFLFNQASSEQDKKFVFFICHSFQMACRFFKVAEITKRKSTAFGVFPVHFINNASEDSIFKNITDPFYAVDSRDYQATKPALNILDKMGAKILAIEKARPHVPYERALMAIRFNRELFGTQFHPEADPEGVIQYLLTEEKKQEVISEHGEAKWQSMIDQLHDPDKILNTFSTMVPNFILDALHQKNILQ